MNFLGNVNNLDVPEGSETDLDLGYEGINLGMMDNMNMPFGVNFDDLPIQKVDSSGSINSSGYNGSSAGKKRSFVETNTADNGKKRFVWPDALHRDFMSAVFDIGLQFATPKELATLMPPDATLTADKVLLGIQKLTLFRERRSDYVSYTDLERRGNNSSSNGRHGSFSDNGQADGGSNYQQVQQQQSSVRSNNSANSLHEQYHGAVPPPTSAMDAPYVPQGRHTLHHPPQPSEYSHDHADPSDAQTAAANALLAQIDAVGESINAQSAHITNLKQLLRKQVKLHALLTQKATEIRASLSSNTKRPFNMFVNNSIRNTCGTLYKMNIVTGDNSFGLSYIDATSKNIYNDCFNYNYTNNTGEDGVAELASMRNNILPSNAAAIVAAARSQSNSVRDAPHASGSAASSSSNRNGVQYMHEMRTNMDIHRKLLMKKEDQLSLHNCNVYIPSAYASEESCNSGYNSFTDHHKYHGYKYTEEDNRLCYADSRKKYTANSYGTESANRERTFTPRTAGSTAAAATANGGSSAGTTPEESSTGAKTAVAAGGSYQPPSAHAAPSSWSSSSSSNGHNPTGAGSNPLPSYDIFAAQAASAAQATGTYNSFPFHNPTNNHATTQAESQSGGGGSNTSGMSINPITGMMEYFLEPDMEMDLFSFLLDGAGD
jgi:hypothetical protein